MCAYECACVCVQFIALLWDIQDPSSTAFRYLLSGNTKQKRKGGGGEGGLRMCICLTRPIMLGRVNHEPFVRACVHVYVCECVTVFGRVNYEPFTI